MKHWLKFVGVALIGATLLVSSGVGWYAFSTPSVQSLPLAPDLIAASSVEGMQMLSRTSTKTDYGQLAPEFVAQSRRGYCGVASSVAVINAILRPQPRVNQSTLFTPQAAAVKGEFAVSFSGLTLEQLGRIVQAHGLQVEVVHATQSNVEAFRETVRATLAEPLIFLVANYDRSSLGQEGPGHISPVGAYDSDTDRVLILDVAAYKYPYTWVPLSKLWSAMNTTDPDSGQSRGYVLVSAGVLRGRG
jgi:glutathione-S-conjugate glycine hydrolase